MRLRSLLAALSLMLVLAATGCSSKPSSNSAPDANNSASSNPADTNAAQPSSTQPASTQPSTAQPTTAQEAPPREPLVVPARTAITIRLGADLGSKLSQPGQSFSGTIAKNVLAGNDVAIPRGAQVTGTVVDAKPLGRFKGGALLQVRLDSINVNGSDRRVQTSAKTFTEKGKGKRTAVMAGGGAALGGLIGGLAGGGKGAAIGLAAGGGAGAGGAAFTGNKEVVLPAESALTFELTRSLEIRQ